MLKNPEIKMLKNPEIQIFEIQPEDIGVVVLKVSNQEKPYRCMWILGGTDGALSLLDNPADVLEYGKNGVISCLVNDLNEADDFVKKSYNEWFSQYEKQLKDEFWNLNYEKLITLASSTNWYDYEFMLSKEDIENLYISTGKHQALFLLNTHTIEELSSEIENLEI